MDRTSPDFSDVSMSQRSSGTVRGIAHIAVDIEWYVAERMGRAPLIASEFKVRLRLRRRCSTITCAVSWRSGLRR